MKLLEIYNSKPILQGLLTHRMPGRLAYSIAKNIRLIDQELDAIEEGKQKILSENWAKNPDTGQHDVPETDKEKFRILFQEFLQTESDLKPCLIKLELFEQAEGLTPLDFLALDFLLEKEEN